MSHLPERFLKASGNIICPGSRSLPPHDGPGVQSSCPSRRAGFSYARIGRLPAATPKMGTVSDILPRLIACCCVHPHVIRGLCEAFLPPSIYTQSDSSPIFPFHPFLVINLIYLIFKPVCRVLERYKKPSNFPQRLSLSPRPATGLKLG